ncbi:hypothetical protein [Microvirga makkahensis]|uniref:Uncharacterized protein n=1 Tax=Microvirga makkahensis TaxID=1128670 RepID=A0A7X3MUL3_9HYPH|nr:hypothetical protein [Microvirga makkahensis]MXQ13363.1 hypothetical protein [Microvirga makkahensis]
MNMDFEYERERDSLSASLEDPHEWEKGSEEARATASPAARPLSREARQARGSSPKRMALRLGYFQEGLRTMTDQEVEVVAEELAKIGRLSWYPGRQEGPFVRAVTTVTATGPVPPLRLLIASGRRSGIFAAGTSIGGCRKDPLRRRRPTSRPISSEPEQP